MPLPRFIEIDGRRYLWRDLIEARRAQTAPKVPQPTLFELHEDRRPAGERTAAERYREPSLFTVLDAPVDSDYRAFVEIMKSIIHE